MFLCSGPSAPGDPSLMAVWGACECCRPGRRLLEPRAGQAHGQLTECKGRPWVAPSWGGVAGLSDRRGWGPGRCVNEHLSDLVAIVSVCVSCLHLLTHVPCAWRVHSMHMVCPVCGYRAWSRVRWCPHLVPSPGLWAPLPLAFQLEPWRPWEPGGGRLGVHRCGQRGPATRAWPGAVGG